jgi:tetratricopeptide (TPR) repeat protein
VRQPDLVASYSADELQKLVDQFPYCQPLRILQLRHLKDNDSIQYSQKLKVTAAFAPDRVRLYQLMHNVSPEVSTSVSTPVFESSTLENTYSDVTIEEVDLTPSEPELTPQEIVENRLKELNLWKENKSEETEISAHINIPKEGEELNSEALNIETLNSEAQKEHDPLEDLIKEAIVETQTKESDYFTEIGLSEDEEETAEVELEIQKQDLILQHQEEDEVATEIVIEEFLSPQPSSEAIAEVEVEEKHIAPTAKITAEDHSSEAHSFAEWLRINHPHDEEETTSTASPVVEIVEIIEPKEETPIIASTPIIPEAEINDIPFEQPSAYVIEANEQAHEEEEKTSNINIPANAAKAAEPTSTDLSATVGRPATADKPTAKVLYMKGGAVEATPAPRPAPAERPQPRELYRSSPTPQPAYTPPPQFTPMGPVAPSVEAPITPAASNENNGPSLRTNRELGLKEVIKPSKKGKKSRPNTENSQNQADKKVPGKNEQIKIIEQFIQQEPRITPMKAYNNPVNMARKSVQESDELVTETLAAIYAQQGNFEKAISFYEKLSLKIPEKSAYFAALIKDLKNKLNS